MRDYKVCVMDGDILIDTTWTGDNFDSGMDALAYTVERIARLVRIGDLVAGTTRIVLAQFDGTAERETVV